MIIESAGGTVSRFPLRLEASQRHFGREAFLQSLSPRTRAVVLCSPDNPTGFIYSEDDLRFIGNAAVEHGFLVITDEVYEDFIYTNVHYRSLAALDPAYRERTILINSFSKTYAMTGWRLGYNAAPASIMAAMTKMNAVAGRAAAAFTQQAGVTALQGGRDAIEAMAAEYAARRALMLEHLEEIPDLSYSAPDGAFYVFVDCAAWGLPSRELADRLLELGGVVVTPGDYYGPAGQGCLRLSFASSRNAIERGMEGLGRALDTLRKIRA
jgi:aspartate/methionine/tyrosine aminotransferase